MSAEIETLHEPFASYLLREGIPYVRARSDVKSTIQEGHPDFTLLHSNHCLLIEFKDKESGRLSTKQEERIAALEGAGCMVHVVRELAHAIELAKAWRSMLGVPAPAKPPPSPEDKLLRFGNGIFRMDGGRLRHVRTALPADHAIPLAAG